MRILIVSDYAFPNGGVERLIRDLKGELAHRGHDVRIFSTNLGQESGANFADFHCSGSQGRVRTLLQTWNPSALGALRRVLNDFEPDIVHVRMFLTQLSPAILPLLRGRPSIYHLAWYRLICPTGLKRLPGGTECNERWGLPCLRHRCLAAHDWPLRMFQLSVANRWLSAFNAIVANSNFVAGRMAREGIATRVVHNGIAVPCLGGEPDEGFAARPTILFAGRLEVEKGCMQLLLAFRELLHRIPTAELVVAGDGKERSMLENSAKLLGAEGNVRFTGFLLEDALRREARQAWMQVVPSLWDEPFGIAALEGMMQARPVIASPRGGLPEIIDHGVTGYLVDPSATTDLVRSMSRLIADRRLAVQIGAAARERAIRHFSIERCSDKFEAIYNELTS